MRQAANMSPQQFACSSVNHAPSWVRYLRLTWGRCMACLLFNRHGIVTSPSLANVAKLPELLRKALTREENQWLSHFLNSSPIFRFVQSTPKTLSRRRRRKRTTK